MLVAAVIAVTKMGALADRTADAKQGAILDEQIMSMEIAAREALDVEATAILYGAADALDGRLEAAWKSNDGDAFAESLAEATRLAVLDMPTRLEDDEAAGKALEESVAKTVALVRQGDVAAARANRQRSTLPAFDAFVETNQAVEAQSEEFSEAASEAAASVASGGKRTIIVVAGIALLLAAACAVVITRGITRGVAVILDRLASLRDSDTTDLSSGLAAVATGDLTHPVVADDRPDRRPRRRRDRPDRPRRQRDPRQHRPLDRRTTTRCASSSPA